MRGFNPEYLVSDPPPSFPDGTVLRVPGADEKTVEVVAVTKSAEPGTARCPVCRGCAVDVKGCDVDAKGCAVDVKGCDVDAPGRDGRQQQPEPLVRGPHQAAIGVHSLRELGRLPLHEADGDHGGPHVRRVGRRNLHRGR
eukprot:1189663-Prorocentrum_minimum.AAC.1